MKLLFFSSFWRLIAAQVNEWEALSRTGSIPSARRAHTAVWSDVANGFYIFGGYDDTNYFNDLYLYKREANEWEELSPNGSIPSARCVHTAVWSNVANGFYIFAGYDVTNYFNDLYLYKREANEWEELSPNGSIPSARYGHTAVWSDVANGFYIFGGVDVGNSFNDLYLYNREANEWEELSPTGSIPSARYGHTAVWGDVANGFYIFGGVDVGNRFNDLYLYKREANEWERLSPTGSIPSARYGHTAVWSDVANGFYIFGGYDRVNFFNDLYLYKREANEWEELSPTGSIPSVRYFPAAVWNDVANGFYIVGGFDGVGNLFDFYLYHPQRTTSATSTTLTTTSATSTSTTRTEARVESDNWIFMNVGRWTVAATVFYMIIFGVPVAIYAHLMEPGMGMDRE